MNTKTSRLGAVIAALGILCSASAQEKPYTAATPAPAAAAAPAPESSSLDKFFNGKIPEVFAKGKFSFNTRLRYEYAESETLRSSHAFTIRPRFGFTTASLYGFQGMIEGENVTVIGPERNFNAAGSNGQATKTIIADPPTTELNQAWLSYSNWDSVVKGGRQRIVLDNQRFVGDVGWRQNMQTFDAVTFENKSIKDLSFYYGYIWEVNRVFGDVSGLPAANKDFKSESHIINISYSGWKYGKFTAYGYLLDFNNPPVAAANSSATFGASFAGGYTFDKDTNTKVNYRLEYAHQTDYRNQPLSYDANYYNVELGGEYDRFNAGAGYEELGSDGGRKGFSTPLATLHAFNGWVDAFLATPATGLRDTYAWAGVTLPWNIPLKVVFHQFDADFGSASFGHEWDALLTRKFGKHWAGLVKYGYLDGKAPTTVNTHKFWTQIEYNF